MKSYKQYKEGVNPTDFDSAGTDQDLKNIGVPFYNKEMEKVIKDEKNRSKIEIEYQKKIFEKMLKLDTKDDPSKIDVSKPAEPVKEKTIDNENRIMKDFIAKMDKWNKENMQARANIPVKTTSTAFRPEIGGIYSRKDDDDKGNADRPRNKKNREQKEITY